MNYVNVVKFKVKEAHLDEFEKKVFQHKSFRGLLNEYFVNTGKFHYVGIGIWESEKMLIDARPAMISFLDSIRYTLEELSPELGVTDAVSGHVVYDQSKIR